MQHGPGTENAYGGVAQAWSESVPILVMPVRLCAPPRLGRAQLQFQRPDARHHQVGRAGHLGQGAVRDHAPRVHAAALRARRPGAGRGAERRVERGGRPVRLRRRRAPLRSGPDPDAIREAAKMLLAAKRPGALRRPGRALGGGLGRAEGSSPSCSPFRSPPACRARARFPRRIRSSLGSGGLAIPAPVHHFLERGRPDPRHRLLVHADELRRHDAGRQDHHPRDARPDRREQGRRRARSRCWATPS